MVQEGHSNNVIAVASVTVTLILYVIFHNEYEIVQLHIPTHSTEKVHTQLLYLTLRTVATFSFVELNNMLDVSVASAGEYSNVTLVEVVCCSSMLFTLGAHILSTGAGAKTTTYKFSYTSGLFTECILNPVSPSCSQVILIFQSDRQSQ